MHTAPDVTQRSILDRRCPGFCRTNAGLQRWWLNRHGCRQGCTRTHQLLHGGISIRNARSEHVDALQAQRRITWCHRRDHSGPPVVGELHHLPIATTAPSSCLPRHLLVLLLVDTFGKRSRACRGAQSARLAGAVACCSARHSGVCRLPPAPRGMADEPDAAMFQPSRSATRADTRPRDPKRHSACQGSGAPVLAAPGCTRQVLQAPEGHLMRLRGADRRFSGSRGGCRRGALVASKSDVACGCQCLAAKARLASMD